MTTGSTSLRWKVFVGALSGYWYIRRLYDAKHATIVPDGPFETRDKAEAEAGAQCTLTAQRRHWQHVCVKTAQHTEYTAWGAPSRKPTGAVLRAARSAFAQESHE